MVTHLINCILPMASHHVKFFLIYFSMAGQSFVMLTGNGLLRTLATIMGSLRLNRKGENSRKYKTATLSQNQVGGKNGHCESV